MQSPRSSARTTSGRVPASPSPQGGVEHLGGRARRRRVAHIADERHAFDDHRRGTNDGAVHQRIVVLHVARPLGHQARGAPGRVNTMSGPMRATSTPSGRAAEVTARTSTWTRPSASRRRALDERRHRRPVAVGAPISIELSPIHTMPPSRPTGSSSCWRCSTRQPNNRARGSGSRRSRRPSRWREHPAHVAHPEPCHVRRGAHPTGNDEVSPHSGYAATDDRGQGRVRGGAAARGAPLRDHRRHPSLFLEQGGAITAREVAQAAASPRARSSGLRRQDRLLDAVMDGRSTPRRPAASPISVPPAVRGPADRRGRDPAPARAYVFHVLSAASGHDARRRRRARRAPSLIAIFESDAST
jgi:hypothetical protein